MAQPDPIGMRQSAPRARSRLAAAFFSLLLPGLGQLYAGRPRRAAALFGVLFAYGVVTAFCRYGWLPNFWIAACVILAAPCIWLFAIVDAAVVARRGATAGGHYDRWYLALGLLIAAPLVAVGLNATVASISTGPGYYEMSSGNMAPTLRVGETLLVDTRYFLGHPPAGGDVVAFIRPQQSDTRSIARIVAVAGDRIEIGRGHIVVNDRPVDEPYIDAGDSGFALNNRSATTVPAGTVYVLGDNRANSADSRLYGPLPIGALIGRATEILLSADVDRIGRWVGTPAR